MATLRTKQTQDSYDDHKAQGHLENNCPLCTTETIEDFTFWRVVDNRFPYDKISNLHHMIVPKRHITEVDLTVEEQNELFQLKNSVLNKKYMYIFEALPGMKSIPEHLHYHLIVVKEEI